MDILKGLGGILKHPLDEAKWMFDETKNVIKDPKEIKHVMGDHQRMMSDNITIPLIGDNKIAKNSDAIAGTIIGGILAAPAMAGGAGASGGAGGAAGGGAASPAAAQPVGEGFFGNLGSYFNPQTAGSKWGSLFETNVTDAELGNLADAEANGAVEANLSGKGPNVVDGADALDIANKGKGGFDAAKLARVLQSVKPQEELRAPSVSMGAGRSGFNFDSKSMSNPLLTKAYSDLYYKPNF